MSIYVQLTVDPERYAIPVERVLRVATLGEVTAVPGSPPALLGVRSLRGQILPVINLCVLLGISAKAPPACLLVAEAGGREGGLAVDEVIKVGEMDDPTEETKSDLLCGATLSGGQLIGVIDVARVFDSVEARGGA